MPGVRFLSHALTHVGLVRHRNEDACLDRRDIGLWGNILFLEPTLVAAVGASGGFDSDLRPTTYRRALELIGSLFLDVGFDDVKGVKAVLQQLLRDLQPGPQTGRSAWT